MEDEEQPISSHPVLTGVHTALANLVAAEAALTQAQEYLHTTLCDLTHQIGENTELANAVINYLYWRVERVPSACIAEAFHLKVHQVLEVAGPVGCMCTCTSCGQPFEFTLSSRTAFHQWLKEMGGPDKWEYHLPKTCEECKAKQSRDYRQQHEERQAALKARLYELKTMPYAEYLQTPEWQARRQQHLKSSGFRCQICNAYGVRLNVHHRTYERRGEEYFKDLITLCETCHTIFHTSGRLSSL